MSRVDLVIELALDIAQKRDELVVLELRLEGLVGGGEPGKTEPVKVAAATATPNGDGNGKGPGRYPRKSDPVRDEIVELAKEGLPPSRIATKLGVDLKAVSNYVFRARKAGQIPKVEKRQ
jgi:DNA-binding NarL/FixJ family response regulator